MFTLANEMQLCFLIVKHDTYLKYNYIFKIKSINFLELIQYEKKILRINSKLNYLRNFKLNFPTEEGCVEQINNLKKQKIKIIFKSKTNIF